MPREAIIFWIGWAVFGAVTFLGGSCAAPEQLATDTAAPLFPRAVARNGLLLTLRQPGEAFVYGGPILLEATFRNVSEKPLTLRRFSPESVLAGHAIGHYHERFKTEVTIKRVAGKPADADVFEWTSGVPDRGGSFELAPGEEKKFTFDLVNTDSLGIVDSPGRFRVLVEYEHRFVAESGADLADALRRHTVWTGWVRSNMIELVVAGRRDPARPRR